MEGLFLILIAFILLIAEAHLPTFGLLGIAGIISLLSGGHFIIEQGGIFGIQLGWSFFIGLAITASLPLLFAGLVVSRNYKKKPVAGIEGMIGHEAKIIEWSGKTGRVHAQGELWAAHSEHEYQLTEGDTVTISGLRDMSLQIHKKS